MKNLRVERGYSLERFPVNEGVGMVQIVEEFSVIKGIPRKEDLRISIQQSDAAGRVSGQMKNLEGAVAQVEHIAFIQVSREWCRGDRESHRIKGWMGGRIDNRDLLPRAGIDRCGLCRCGMNACFRTVTQALVEFVKPAI